MADAETQVQAGPAEALAEQAKEPCSCCRLLKPLTDLTSKPGRSKKVCRGCYSVSATLQRNGISLDAQLDEQSIEAFYKSCAEERVRNPKDKLTYQKVRAQVKQQLVRRHTRAWQQNSGGPFLPLSMWEKKGLTTQQLKDVEEKGNKKEHAILGMTYQVPIDEETYTQTFAEAEEQLLTLESNFKKRKLPQAKGKAKAKAQAVEDLPEAVEVFSDLESGDEEPAGSSDKKHDKSGKALARLEAKKAQKLFAKLTAALGNVARAPTAAGEAREADRVHELGLPPCLRSRRPGGHQEQAESRHRPGRQGACACSKGRHRVEGRGRAGLRRRQRGDIAEQERWLSAADARQPQARGGTRG